MAFGKPPDIKILKVTPNVEDQLWKAHVTSEEIASESWQTKWGWILNEYSALQAKMQDASKNSVTLPIVAKKRIENRTTKPVPVTETDKYGWLAARPEFKLEKYGPDVYKGMPFVSLTGF